MFTEALAFVPPKVEVSTVDIALVDEGVTHYSLRNPTVHWEKEVATVLHKDGSLRFNTSRLISIIITYPKCNI